MTSEGGVALQRVWAAGRGGVGVNRAGEAWVGETECSTPAYALSGHNHHGFMGLCGFL